MFAKARRIQNGKKLSIIVLLALAVAMVVAIPSFAKSQTALAWWEILLA